MVHRYSTSKTIEMGFLFYRYSSKGNWVHQFRGNLKFEKFISLMKTRKSPKRSDISASENYSPLKLLS